MTQAKTKPTQQSVDQYLQSRASPAQLIDSKSLMALLSRATHELPVMWGPSIVGYGQYNYKYESGRVGQSCATGFAIRGKEFVIYLLAEDLEQQALLAQLGRHKMGKSCLYFRSLADLDSDILEKLVVNSVAEIRRRYPQ